MLARDPPATLFCSGTLDESEHRALWKALVEADFFHQPESYDVDDGEICPSPEAGTIVAARVGEARHVVYFDPCPARGVPQAVLDLVEALETGAKRATNCGASSCIATGCYGEICAPSPQKSDCVWLDEYACYQSAFCQPQGVGECGFTTGPYVDECLADR